jgi:hypothetical protein
MITANELRIGNIVDYFSESADTWLDNHCLTANDILCLDDRTVDRANPIPLTEEWLIRFGFEKEEINTRQGSTEMGFVKSIMMVLKANENYYAAPYGFPNANIMHIHTLQNAFFALTQNELTLSNP